MNKIRKYTYSGWQLVSLTSLRVFIGWHFLYEGLVKFYSPEWTSRSFLANSIGPFGSVFKSMVSHESVLQVVDILNEWGLLLIGLGLFAGLLANPCKILGIILLLLYYLAYPSFASLGINTNAEGSYWIVNKNLIEMVALWVLYQFPTSHITGIDRFFEITNKSGS